MTARFWTFHGTPVKIVTSTGRMFIRQGTTREEIEELSAEFVLEPEFIQDESELPVIEFLFQEVPWSKENGNHAVND